MPVIDPFSHNSVLYRGAQTQLEKDDPNFFEVVGASVGYTYDPMVEYVSNAIKFRGEEDESYLPLEDIDGYEAYRDDLMDAKNAEHMVELKRAIDENIQRRDILSKATFGQHFFAGLADPVNLVALPFGGPVIGLGRSFLKGGARVAGLQTVLEAGRAPFDPVGTKTEVAVNIGTAFVAGGLINTAIAVPATRRANAFIDTKKALGEREIAHTPDINTNYVKPTPDRPLSQVENYEIDVVVDNDPRVIATMQKNVDDILETVTARKAEYDKAVTPEDMKTTKASLDEATESLNVAQKQLNARQDQFNLFSAEKAARSLDEAEIKKIDQPYSLPKNLWTDSWAYKFVTTPMKRVLQNIKVTDEAKKFVLDIAGDSGILLNLHKNGFRVGPSVYQKAAMRDGEWVQVYDELRNIYGKEYGKGKQTILDYNAKETVEGVIKKIKREKKSANFFDFITEVNVMRMKGETPKSEAASKAMKLLDNYYEEWEKRLSSTGLIGSVSYYKNRSMMLDGEIAQRQSIVDGLKNKPNRTELEDRRLAHNRKMVSKAKTEKENADLQIESMKNQRLMPANEEKFHPRYWNKKHIEANRAEFFEILKTWYQTNPYVYVMKDDKWVQIRTDSSLEAVTKRVNDTIDKILGIDDVTAESVASYGYGRSKHFRHREVDIPNKLVVDFIEQNPITVMKTYTAKIAPQYELALKFGKSFDDKMDEIEDGLIANGLSEQEINAYMRDVRHLNDRVQGTVIRNPEAMSLRAAIVLKDLAMMNYLGSAGFSTLPDFAKVMMEHEMGTIWKSLFATMDNGKVKMTAEEGRLAGEIIDILKGDAHMRFSENMSNNPLNDGLMSKMRTGFFMLNGVAPMTAIFKKMDAMARGHTLIDYSVKVTNGTASEFEVSYLARYNIGKQEAKEIANSPWEMTDNGLYLPNTLEWKNKGTVENFRASMNSGIGNTVLMGTPADKPIAVDGVFYVPMHVARKVYPNVKEDTKYRGYYRIENALLSMPFQFLSYSFAAANKITASIAQGQVKNRAIALSTSMGLGYMSMELKYKDWQMEKMSLTDKIARSFDASGIASLQSDMFYTSMGISLALGGPDIGAGIIKPKFNQKENTLDAITAIGGAGPSYAVDVGRGVAKFLDGDFGEGSADLLRRMPFAQLHFLKDTTNETARAFAGGRY